MLYICFQVNSNRKKSRYMLFSFISYQNSVSVYRGKINANEEKISLVSKSIVNDGILFII